MADNVHTPTLLGLPTELLIVVAERLSLAEDICNLRSTCYDMAMRIHDEFVSRVALPITMDDEGCQTLEYAITSNNERLPPLAAQVTRIRLADLGHATSAVAYCRNMDIEPFQSMDILTHYIDENREVAYHGYRQHGPCLEWTEAMPFMEPTIDDEGVTKVAQLLPKFPKLSAIGTFMRRTEFHLLYNSEYPFVVNDDELYGASKWFGSIGPPEDEWSQEHRIHRWIVRYSSSSHLDSLYSATFVRPAFLDLHALDSALSKHSQKAFSNILTRLSITTEGLPLKSMSDDDTSRKADLVAFVRGCANLERLLIRLGEDGARSDDPDKMLRGDVLPRLTHLKVEGACWTGLECRFMIEDKASKLQFFYLKPLKWECNAFVKEQLEPLTRTIEQIPRVVIDFGGLGFEQGMNGGGFEKLAERIKWREGIMQEWFQDPHQMMYLNANQDLDEELRDRVGILADGRDDDPREMAEEAQTPADRRREFIEEFAGVNFD